MRKIYIIILILFTHINAYAQWSAVNKINGFTDKKINYIVYEDNNHIVQIDGDLVKGWMIVTRKKIGFIYQDTFVKFRVDKRKIYNVDIPFMKNTFNEKVSIDNKTVAFELHTIAHAGNLLCEMIKGNVLKIQYNTSSKVTENLDIPLKGVTNIIYKAFDKKSILPYCEAIGI